MMMTTSRWNNNNSNNNNNNNNKEQVQWGYLYIITYFTIVHNRNAPYLLEFRISCKNPL